MNGENSSEEGRHLLEGDIDKWMTKVISDGDCCEGVRVVSWVNNWDPSSLGDQRRALWHSDIRTELHIKGGDKPWKSSGSSRQNSKRESSMARVHMVCAGTERCSLYMVHDEEGGNTGRGLRGQSRAVADSVGLWGPWERGSFKCMRGHWKVLNNEH